MMGREAASADSLPSGQDPLCKPHCILLVASELARHCSFPVYGPGSWLRISDFPEVRDVGREKAAKISGFQTQLNVGLQSENVLSPWVLKVLYNPMIQSQAQETPMLPANQTSPMRLS